MPVVSYGFDTATIESHEATQNKEQGELKQRVAEELKKAGILEFEWVGERGAPGDVICNMAYEKGVDCLIMGDQGFSGITRFLLGSICTYCLHHAPCSVLIVKDEKARAKDYASLLKEKEVNQNTTQS